MSEGALISQEEQTAENLVKRFSRKAISRLLQALENSGVPYWSDKVELIGMEGCRGGGAWLRFGMPFFEPKIQFVAARERMSDKGFQFWRFRRAEALGAFCGSRSKTITKMVIGHHQLFYSSQIPVRF